MRGRHQFSALIFVATMVCFRLNAQAQENKGPAETIDESLARVEGDLGLLQSGHIFDRQDVVAHRAWGRLKAILQSNPDDNMRARVAQDMIPLEEFFGNHDLAIAEFYLKREHEGHGGRAGARSRLDHIIEEFPHYSKMDRVLLRLADTYVSEDDEDQARDHLLKLVCKYPASDYSIKAFERLNQIGFRAWDGCDKYKQ